MSTNSLTFQWWPARWYWHFGYHECLTPRTDGRTNYYWLALGPLDLRWNVRPPR